ncbi:MAG: (4Fe-4S)-binding protein [Candidatus Brocadiia bacterium]
MLTAEDVKKTAKALGADLVSIGSIDRWEGAPRQMDPRQILPEARSVIGMGFRVMRGSLRGVEEGTYFSNYSSMGYGGLNWLYMPMVAINLSKFIEDHGHEAVPYGHLSPWRGITNDGHVKSNYSRPVAEGRAAPDVMIHLRIAGFLCGLGEIGFSKIFLTPRFGPRQRLGIIITEAELEPDPIYDGPALCDRCLECVDACPIGAFDPDQTVKVTLAGREVEWMDPDLEACDMAFRGGVVDDDVSDEESYNTWHGHNTRPGWWSPFESKPPNLYEYGKAICGARGCMRACMIHLEERGVLENTFKQPFRRRQPWRVDWSAAPPETQDPSEDWSQEG